MTNYGRDQNIGIPVDTDIKDIPAILLDEIIKAIQDQGTNTFSTPYTEIPGVGAASIYAAGDAFGTMFSMEVPKQGTIQTVIMLDLDDEGIETELWLFRETFTATADNSAFAVTDGDLVKLEVVIGITNFANANVNQIGINNNLGLSYEAPLGRLFCQCVTRGTPNIAVGNAPRMRISGISYE